MTSYVDINGFREIKDNPISKIGVYPYLGKDIPGAPDPTAIYYVYRPEEELADPACVNSFRLLPWVDEHTTLGEGHTPAEQKGILGTIGDDVYYRDGFLRANIKIFAKMLGELIDSGKKELSPSYRCTYEYAPGVYDGMAYQYIQRNIRGNHLALVKEGRTGQDVCVQDNLDLDYTFTIDSKELSPMAEVANENEGKDEGEMTIAEISAFIKKIAPQLKALTEGMAALQPAPAATTSTEDEDNPDDEPADATANDKAIKDVRKLAEDTAASVKALGAGLNKSLLSQMAQREKLVSRLTPHIGNFDHSEMDLNDVAKYGVEKLGIACDSGEELSTLNGYLLAKQAQKPTVSQDSQVRKNSGSAIMKYAQGGAA